MNVYFIPGLGFDCRIFDKLELPGFEKHYLNYLEPEGQESLQSYVKRMAKQINTSKEQVSIIGHSLGGIMAQEIGRYLPIKHIILVSSIRDRSEMPLFFRMVQPMRLHRLFNKKITFNTFPLWGKTHGYVTEEEQELFKSMVNKQSDHYLQWALQTLSCWQKKANSNQFISDTKVFQIHGDRDKTFPIKLLYGPDRVLEGAGHFMVYRRAEELSEEILRGLEG